MRIAMADHGKPPNVAVLRLHQPAANLLSSPRRIVHLRDAEITRHATCSCPDLGNDRARPAVDLLPKFSEISGPFGRSDGEQRLQCVSVGWIERKRMGHDLARRCGALPRCEF